MVFFCPYWSFLIHFHSGTEATANLLNILSFTIMVLLTSVFSKCLEVSSVWQFDWDGMTEQIHHHQSAQGGKVGSGTYKLQRPLRDEKKSNYIEEDTDKSDKDLCMRSCFLTWWSSEATWRPPATKLDCQGIVFRRKMISHNTFWMMGCFDPGLSLLFKPGTLLFKEC